jgi:hypothetical protein
VRSSSPIELTASSDSNVSPSYNDFGRSTPEIVRARDRRVDQRRYGLVRPKTAVLSLPA